MVRMRAPSQSRGKPHFIEKYQDVIQYFKTIIYTKTSSNKKEASHVIKTKKK